MVKFFFHGLLVGINLMIIFMSIMIYTDKMHIDMPKKVMAQTIKDYNVTDCYDLNLFDTVNCTVKYVTTFYKYNETDDNIILSFDELKNRGGDCKDWSEFYVSEMLKYNFSGEVYTFNMNKKYNHAIANIHNDMGYCIIDQQGYSCFNFAKD
jgi:hypothetical protein